MFTPEHRERIRAELLELAARDERLSGGAITGSGSVGRLDAWSDIDLAFGVREGFSLDDVLATYTVMIYERYEAVHHLDVKSGAWIYRVFFLASTLQLDFAVAPAALFGARSPTFQLVFGNPGPVAYDSSTPLDVLTAWCWLNALHVRSALARDRLWQAEFFVSALRNYAIAFLCRRHGLLEYQGRGVDQLPEVEKRKLEPTLVKALDGEELRRAFRATLQLCLAEIKTADTNLFERLQLSMSALST